MFGHKSKIISIKYSPNGLYLASGGADFSVKLWRVDDNQLMYSFNDQSSDVVCVQFSFDSRYLAIRYDCGIFTVKDLYNNNILMEDHSHQDLIYIVQVSPNSQYILSISRDRTFKIWDLQTFQFKKQYRIHLDCDYDIKAAQFHGKDDRIFAIGFEYTKKHKKFSEDISQINLYDIQ